MPKIVSVLFNGRHCSLKVTGKVSQIFVCLGLKELFKISMEMHSIFREPLFQLCNAVLHGYWDEIVRPSAYKRTLILRFAWGNGRLCRNRMNVVGECTTIWGNPLLSFSILEVKPTWMAASYEIGSYFFLSFLWRMALSIFVLEDRVKCYVVAGRDSGWLNLLRVCCVCCAWVWSHAVLMRVGYFVLISCGSYYHQVWIMMIEVLWGSRRKGHWVAWRV